MTAPNKPDGATLLIDYYTGTFKRLRIKGRSETSHKQYLIQLRHFDRFLGRPATLADLDDDTVTALLVDRAEKTSPENANKCRNHVLALWRFAARKGHVAQFPDVERLQERKRIPQAWSHEQLARLVEAAYHGLALQVSHRQPLVLPCLEIPGNLWWTGLILVLYETGIRVGAALKLRTGDVDLETGRLLVRAEIQKHHADQVFTLTPDTRAILRDCAAVERELLFPYYRSEGSFYADWRRLLKNAGLPTGRRCGPHRIRRTTATLAELYIGRGTATGILGHSSAHVTRAYIDTSMLPENRFAERLPRPLLVGRKNEDGTLPTPEALLPAPPPAPVPIEHSVSGLILPRETVAENHPLLDADILTVIGEFSEWRKGKVSERWRWRSINYLLGIATALKMATLRDFDGAAVQKWIQGGHLARSVAEAHVSAAHKFAEWIVREREVFFMLRKFGPFLSPRKWKRRK